ncbi:hypothetical protein BDZ94DRAFT_937799 [Collybia nuda]|uniref:Uncharacterized protein n=1 Tax=Collybia nuda TaxID=64659 RepID=A0A9P5Y2Z8_9AGAR|nr:hypothetical protein BDZ94DRAFT_937799 [Collybia nuda]
MDSFADECRTDLNHPSIRHRGTGIETSSGLIHFSSSLDLLASVAVDEGLQLSQSPSAVGALGMKQFDPVSMGACSSGSPQYPEHLTISLNNTQIQPHANDENKAIPENLIFGGGQIRASIALQYLDMSKLQGPRLTRALRESPPSRHRRSRSKFSQGYTKGNFKATANRNPVEWLRGDSIVDSTVKSEHELVDGSPVEVANRYQPLRRSARKRVKLFRDTESLESISLLLDPEPQRDMSPIGANPKSHKFWYWVEVEDAP